MVRASVSHVVNNDHQFFKMLSAVGKTIVEQKALGIDLDKPEKRQGVMVTPFE